MTTAFGSVCNVVINHPFSSMEKWVLLLTVEDESLWVCHNYKKRNRNVDVLNDFIRFIWSITILRFSSCICCLQTVLQVCIARGKLGLPQWLPIIIHSLTVRPYATIIDVTIQRLIAYSISHQMYLCWRIQYSKANVSQMVGNRYSHVFSLLSWWAKTKLKSCKWVPSAEKFVNHCSRLIGSSTAIHPSLFFCTPSLSQADAKPQCVTLPV